MQTQKDKCVNIVRQINTTCATFVIKKVQRSWCINQILARSIGIYSDWVYLSDLSNSIFADTFFNAVDRFIFLMLGMSTFCARCIWVILIQIFLPIYCLGKAQFLKPSFSPTKVLHVQLCILLLIKFSFNFSFYRNGIVQMKSKIHLLVDMHCRPLTSSICVWLLILGIVCIECCKGTAIVFSRLLISKYFCLFMCQCCFVLVLL